MTMPCRKKPLTPAETALILELRKGGASVAAIAKQLRRTKYTIGDFLRLQGLSANKNNMPKEDKEEARRLREAGWDYNDIAAKLGRAASTIREIFNRPGRDHKRNPKLKKIYETSFHVPESVLADRDYRAGLRPVSITAALMGDPLPTRSALERRA